MQLLIVSLSYLEPPYFVMELEPLEASVGDSVSLQCQVAGTPEITVSWYKGDTKLRPTPEYRTYFTNNVATLVFNKVNINDSGEYTCKAENNIGTASSKTVFRIQGDDIILEIKNFFSPYLLLSLWEIFSFHLLVSQLLLVFLQSVNSHLPLQDN